MQALVRVEGLVRGGAAGLDGFLDMLKPLRQPLTVQINDRSVLLNIIGHRNQGFAYNLRLRTEMQHVEVSMICVRQSSIEPEQQRFCSVPGCH